MSPIRQKGNLLVFAAYLAFFCVLFWPVAFGERSFASPDIYPYYYQIWKFACEEIHLGHLPLWNPYASFGTPFAANPQSCLFYPFSAIWMVGDFTRGLNMYILFHLALAAFSTYFFMREHEAAKAPSLLSGCVFSLGGYAMSTVRLTISLCSVAYFPFVLVLFARALKSKDFRWKAGTAGVLLLQYLAGDPSINGVTLGVCFMMGALRGWRGLLVFLETALLFLVLGAFQIIPFAEFVSLSSRPVADYAAASKWSFPPTNLWELIVPPTVRVSTRVTKEGMPWLENAYAGLVAVFLSLFCLRRNVRRFEKKLFLLCGAGLLLAFGRYGVVHALLYRFVPLFSLLRYPERFLFLAFFSLACLAGLGLAYFSRGRRWIFFAVALLMVADLVLANTALHTVPLKVFQAKPENVRVVMSDPGLFRVMASPQMLNKAYHPNENTSLETELADRRDQFFPNLPQADRLHSLWSYESVYLRNVQALLQSFIGREPSDAKRFWDRWNIRYIASPAEAVPGLERANVTVAANLFRNADAWPRAYFVPEARIVAEADGLQVTGEEMPQAVEVTRYESDRVEMRVEAPQNVWLIFTDAFYPGWRVSVDGKRAKIVRAQKAFRAVWIETGIHQVEWTFKPLSLQIGSLLSLAALLFLLIRLRFYNKLI